MEVFEESWCLWAKHLELLQTCEAVRRIPWDCWAAHSWYDPKPFWYLYFSGAVNFVTGMTKGDLGRADGIDERKQTI